MVSCLIVWLSTYDLSVPKVICAVQLCWCFLFVWHCYDLQADVIVNTTAKNLDLQNGAVSKSILSNAGQQIQDELKRSFPKGIQNGEIAVTNGYRLLCKHVFHGSIISWDENLARNVSNTIYLFFFLLLFTYVEDLFLCNSICNFESQYKHKL